MRAVSLFSGVGGGELGLEAAGIETVLQVEIDRDCREVLAHRWANTPRLEDVHDVTADHLLAGGPLDLLYGGFPCTDISNSYTRDGGIAGLAGARSGLWSELERLTREAAPEWLLIENVQNLLRANAGRDFRTILGVLDGLGYGLAWSLLDARGFGVPQQRRRLFLVGHLGDGAGPAEVLDHANRRQRHADEGFGRGVAYAGLSEDGARAAGPLSIAENQQAEFRVLPFAPCVNTAGGKVGQGYQAFIWGDTLRRYTPREVERLMGYPDDHTRYRLDGSELSDTRRYAMLGNGMAAPVMRWLGERLLAIA